MIRRLAVAFLAMASLLLQSCQTVPDEPRAHETATCCTDNERYPRWLIQVAEPAAPIIGTAISLVSFRKGHFSRHDAERERILSALKPLDVVLLSSKGRLSGRMIPGLFGHAAIYLGTEADYRAIGLWDHPAIKPHQAAIRAGKRFMEADQKGLHLSTADRVFNTDRIAVLRPPSHSGTAERRHVLAFVEHLNGRFDFHFDLAEDHALFCAELIDHAMADVRLRRTIVYGRQTIIPDTMAFDAAKARNGLSLVLFAHATPDAVTFGKARLLIADLARHWSAKNKRQTLPAK